MKNIILILLLASFFLFANTNIKWRSLFNGNDLSGWNTYLGPRYDEAKGDFNGDPIGLDNDPDNVFSVVTIDGKPALRVSGQHFGGISTKEEFENFHLHLEFKWGEIRWIPRKDSKRDSGILYHATGPHAKGWFFWMCSEEFQLQEGDCGDYWGVGGGSADAPAMKKSDTEFAYDPGGEMSVFGSSKSRASARLIKYCDAEKQTGEWNTADLYVHGDSSVYYINDIFVNKLYKLRRGDDDGKEYSLTKGKIQLQSEGAEIYFRDIRVESISRLPEQLKMLMKDDQK